ncbi:MAG: FAD:protein FMN transferase [Burkholderiales bacterium]|nr:FAD:protein FMN transferase [Burkholderiales bacterium]
MANQTTDGATAAPFYETGERSDDHRFHFGAMASACEVRLAGVSRDVAATWAAQAINEVRRIELKYSRYLADSVVSRINASAGVATGCELDAETAQLLAFADQLFHLSDGLFDITSGVLRRAWNFREPQLPSPDRIAALLPLVGWREVRRETVKGTTRVTLPRAGMELDLGGFGKEYAADRAAALLSQAGATRGLVNLGGDLRALGPQSDDEPWSIGIQHPRDPASTIASIRLARGALTTSGDYERYFDLDGKRYCHILNPQTGWPIDGWQAVSVVAPLAVAAGAMSTIAMLKGDAAAAFLATQQVAWLGVDKAGEVIRHGIATC